MAIKDDWMNRKWRPAMGWTYMITCITDFIIFPILWSILQSVQGGQINSQWSPITLQGGGLFHLAMGAVLGVAAWSRGKEKLAGVSSGPTLYNPGIANAYQQEYEYEQQTPTTSKRNLKKPVSGEPPEL